ncbi:hypothetical protein [Nonomuraea basaltis]|uniref:hypothetical protein n=1 Tax=Nonomuraea basaltis TaxID=2495887 RepID=UPI00110C5F5A|nr:hypothetical protein [Nonomuraea basaltis]TMR91249.1 hypothetical protein EJK15_50880 [Nonomuraea basaltis]
MLNIDFPTPCEVAVVDTDMTEIVPIERRADTVMMFTSRWGAKTVVITESQSHEALTTVDTDTAAYIAEQTEIGLGDTKARQIWRCLMTMQNYRFKSEFAEMLRAEGRAEGEACGEARGEAKSVLKILEQRDIPVPEPIRERILACTDLTLLESWLVRSLKAATAEELFD